jgi:Flp pilus assembly protein TadG
MTTHPRLKSRLPYRALAGAGRDRGTVTVIAALAGLALLLMAGLVVDGGGRLRAVGRADRVAGEAARAAVEAADTRQATLALDRRAAVSAAQAHLRAAGVSGTVAVTGSRTVRVTVAVSGSDLILGLVGAGQYTVVGMAEATLSVGVGPGDAR